MPTDHGVAPPASNRRTNTEVLATGPLNLIGKRWEWDST